MKHRNKIFPSVGSLYDVWTNIKQRTGNKACRLYGDYGGRGIDMDQIWFRSYPDFALDVYLLKRKGTGETLDRIDNNRGYYLGNVRWVD